LFVITHCVTTNEVASVILRQAVACRSSPA